MHLDDDGEDVVYDDDDPVEYTVEAGRSICRDGEPFIFIHKADSVPPVEADDITHEIARLLNENA